MDGDEYLDTVVED